MGRGSVPSLASPLGPNNTQLMGRFGRHSYCPLCPLAARQGLRPSYRAYVRHAWQMRSQCERMVMLIGCPRTPRIRPCLDCRSSYYPPSYSLGPAPNLQRLGRPSSTLPGDPWQQRTPPRLSTVITSHSNNVKAPPLAHSGNRSLKTHPTSSGAMSAASAVGTRRSGTCTSARRPESRASAAGRSPGPNGTCPPRRSTVHC